VLIATTSMSAVSPASKDSFVEPPGRLLATIFDPLLTRTMALAVEVKFQLPLPARPGNALPDRSSTAVASIVTW
jgi:hypothetical protein